MEALYIYYSYNEDLGHLSILRPQVPPELLC